MDTVKFVGYDNYSSPDSYLSELNGTTHASTDNVFTQKTAAGAYVLCTHVIPFATPVTGALTFTFTGNQTVASITLSIRTYTGIKTTSRLLDPNEPVNIYSMDGRTIRSNIPRKQALEGLRNGIYILDGKKVAVNN